MRWKGLHNIGIYGLSAMDSLPVVLSIIALDKRSSVMKHTLKRKLSKIHGWLRRNNTLMDQLTDLSRQLTEAWYEKDALDVSFALQRMEILELRKARECMRVQLHRVARERDQERKKRLAAEDALLDMYLDEKEAAHYAQALDAEALDKAYKEE